MEKSKVAGVLYRLIRAQAKKSPRVVALALIAPDTWGVRANFDDGRRDYRYASGGPPEEVRGGFDAWPPSPDVTAGAGERVVIGLPLRLPMRGTDRPFRPRLDGLGARRARHTA